MELLPILPSYPWLASGIFIAYVFHTIAEVNSVIFNFDSNICRDRDFWIRKTVLGLGGVHVFFVSFFEGVIFVGGGRLVSSPLLQVCYCRTPEYSAKVTCLHVWTHQLLLCSSSKLVLLITSLRHFKLTVWPWIRALCNKVSALSRVSLS